MKHKHNLCLIMQMCQQKWSIKDYENHPDLDTSPFMNQNHPGGENGQIARPQRLSSGQIHHWDSVHCHCSSLADSKPTPGRQDKLDITDSPRAEQTEPQWRMKPGRGQVSVEWLMPPTGWGVIQEALVLKDVRLSQMSACALINYRNRKTEMLLCKGHASAELKEESGFNPTEWSDYLSARTLGCWILHFTMATNCANCWKQICDYSWTQQKPWQRTKATEQKRGRSAGWWIYGLRMD